MAVVTNPDKYDASVPEPRADSLGTYFSRQVFSAEEHERIASLASSDGKPAQIIRRYLLRADAYKNTFVKRERIAGCRPGTPHYNTQAIKRLIEHLGEPSTRQYRFYWQLYRDCVVSFLKKEMPALDRLLVEVACPEGATNDIEMVRALCANATDYGVTADHLATFYEIWGTPRIPDFPTLLPQWMKADEAAVQKRQIARVLSELAVLRESELPQLRARVEALVADVRQQQDLSEDPKQALEHALKKLEAAEGWLREHSERLLADVEARVRAVAAKLIDERVVGLVDKMNRLAERAKEPRDEVSTKDLHKLATETKVGISDLTETLTKRMQEEVATATQQLEAKLAEFSVELSHKRDASSVVASQASRYRSPLVGPIVRTHPQYRVSRELEFVTSWMQVLLHQHDSVLTFEQAVAYHRTLVSSSVIVSDRTLALSWIECLGWHSSTIHIAASPTWSEEADWAPAATHLFADGAGRSPRLAVIHNFDVGLVDCYLMPSLALWALRERSKGLAKLFLVPSKHDYIASPSILEHATWFRPEDHLAGYQLALKEGVRLPLSLSRQHLVGVEPKLFSAWQASVDQIDYDFAPMQRALKCRLPNALVQSFRRVASSIRLYLEAPGAIASAMHHQVVPWVQGTYGDTKANELQDLMSAMSGETG